VMVGKLFKEVISLFEQAVFKPLPETVFPVSLAGEAFRTMGQGRHIGKIVLNMRDLAVQVRLDASQIFGEATYLITGGLGGLGLVAAEALVARGARHLVLLSRRPPSSETQVFLAELESRGASITIRSLDIANDAEVAVLFAEIRAKFPPLRGILHAAGLLDDALVRNLTPEKLTSVMSGKVAGALALNKQIHPGELDFLLYYASVAGVLGTSGQANYAAANAILDGLAHQQRARGIPAISIDWGTWADVGLAALKQDRGVRLAGHGLTPLTPEEGSNLLFHILGDSPVQVAAMRFDAMAWCDSNPAARRSGTFAAFLDIADSPTADSADFAEHIRQLAKGDVHPALIAWLREQVAAVLRCSIDRIAPDKPLRTLGLDSLMALELRNRLERGLHLKLSATLAWNYPSVAALATHLETKVYVQAAVATDVRPALPPISAAPLKTNHASGKLSEKVSVQPEASACLSAAELLEAELLGVQSLLSK
jgi:NAD(P)-dependent dehydrogenase (short-subunit alcohol dehydrogenase family)